MLIQLTQKLEVCMERELELEESTKEHEFKVVKGDEVNRYLEWMLNKTVIETAPGPKAIVSKLTTTRNKGEVLVMIRLIEE